MIGSEINPSSSEKLNSSISGTKSGTPIIGSEINPSSSEKLNSSDSSYQ